MSIIELNKFLDNKYENYNSPIGLVVGYNQADENNSGFNPNIINKNNIIKEELYFNLVKSASYSEKLKDQNKPKKTKKHNKILHKKHKTTRKRN